MTFLDEYKRKGMLANPTLLFVFFEELITTKNLVLVRGDLVDGSLVQSEANEIYQQMIMYYMNPDLYNDYVYRFNHDQSSFDLDKFSRLMELNRN